MKKPLLLLVFMISSIITFAQTEKQKAEKYLNERGELAFTFTANNIGEIRKLSSMISFDHGQDPSNPLTVNAVANKKEFQDFLDFELPYTVDSEKNEPKQVQMYNAINQGNAQNRLLAYPLTFPLSAYPTYAQYEAQMTAFATDNPSIAELVNIGTSVNGKNLLFIKLSDNVSTHEQEPRLLLTSSMHGDEIAGYPMMLSLIDFFISVYNDTGHARHTEIKNLIDNSEIWINPMANPDGTFFGDWTNYNTVAGARRANANAIDLNRNYPDPRVGPNPDGNSYQSETVAFMAMADTYHFVTAINFHGGAEVVNYPWDTYTSAQGRHTDDDWYEYTGVEYAQNAQADSPANYMTYDPDGGSPGVTHGATWYQVAGGRQDYMNYYKQCREITMELSDVKIIPAGQIENHWNYNRDALIDNLKQGTYGFTGLVKDANTLNPIKAKITIIGRDDQTNSRNSWVETELPIGDYYRPVKGGTYDILYEAECYQSVTLTNQVITDLQTVNLADVFLTPVAPSVPSGLSASSVTMSSATLNWSSASGGTGYDIRYRVNGSSTWTNTTSTTISLDLASLATNTTYEYQVRSVCNSTTSSYSTSATFTTLAVSYCASRGNSQYNTGVTYVSFNTLSNTDLDNTNNNGYDDFTAMSTTVIQGSTHTLIANTNTDGGYTTYTYVWIDWNRDGDFLDVGESYDLGTVTNNSNGATSNSPLSITVPGAAALGTTRMRVSTKYNANPTSCETGYDGEVEDYTIIVSAVLGVEDTQILNTISVYPNPVKENIFIRVPSQISLVDFRISNILGKTILSDTFEPRANKLNVSSLNTGMYFLTINTDKGVVTKKIIIK